MRTGQKETCECIRDKCILWEQCQKYFKARTYRSHYKSVTYGGAERKVQIICKWPRPGSYKPEDETNMRFNKIEEIIDIPIKDDASALIHKYLKGYAAN